MIKVVLPEQERFRSVSALFAFTLIVIVEEVLVIVLVVAVDSHSDQPDQRANVDRVFVFTACVFRAADCAAAREQSSQTTQQQLANVHVRPFS